MFFVLTGAVDSWDSPFRRGQPAPVALPTGGFSMSYQSLLTRLGTRESRRINTTTELVRWGVYGVNRETGAREPMRGNGRPESSALEPFDADSLAIVYHTTAVVVFHPDESVTLSTGGWYSRTTRARILDAVDGISISGPLRRSMGDFGRPGLYSTPCEGGPWSLHCAGGAVEFTEGITLDADRRPVDFTTEPAGVS